MSNKSKHKELNLHGAGKDAIILESSPFLAWVSFTGRCNLRCVHCPRSSYQEEPSHTPDMSLEVFHKLEENLFPFLKKCKIGGNSLGEQLLAEEWNHFSEQIEKYSFERILVTNGLLLTKEKITRLVERGWTIDLSVEGGTKSTYERVRGKNFERFIEVVRECCQQKKALQETKTKIRFCFTTFYDNIREILQLIELGARLGVDEVLVTHLIPMREYQRNQSLVYHKGLANSIFEEGKRRAQELGISIKLPPLFPIKRINEINNLVEDASSSWNETICHHPWTSVSINEKGDVMPCCVSETKMGNIREANFEEIWNNRKYQNLRKTVNSSAPIGSCRHCSLRGKDFTNVHCNDDGALLTVIGPTNQIDTHFFLKLTAKKVLGKSARGKKILEKMKTMYKKFTL